MTLYGTTDSLYRELCGIKNGFSRVSGALRKLKDNGFNLSVNLTITKTNYPDLGNIVRFAQENGYVLRPTTYIFGTAPNCIEERLSPDDAARAALEVYRLTHAEAEFKKYIAEQLLRLKAGKKNTVSEMKLPGITCRAGTASYWVHSDGKMNFCGMVADEASPNVFALPFERAWQDAVQKAASVERCGVCDSCEDRFICRKCHAMLQCEGVRPEDVEKSYACKYYKAFASEIIRIGKIYGSVSDN